ncbi:set domain-containing 5 [Triangularia setosa]|uniref:Set domain-containing 5 n=1 Tax=Triangularia setosa TaxID=2587417 RepID=A0AAN7A834_9PEZI|nr:set domain-containing 5 [Podospora setosa]
MDEQGGREESAGPRVDPAGNEHPAPSSAPQASFLYAVQTILDKGQGLVATSKITKGTRILSEAPLFKVPPDKPNRKVKEALIIKELKRLDKDQQRAYFALHNAHGTDHSPFLGIARTNVLPLGSQAREGGLFLEASRINHSCRPNAQNTWNANIGRLTIHALRDIKEGEEITITYLDQTTEYVSRQQFLKGSFSFGCRCELCVLPPARRRESDGRLSEINSIDEKLGQMGSRMFGYNKILHLLRTMFRLFEEEGIWDASIPRAYYDAFQIACMYGDDTRAKIFAERAHAARVIIEGDDSPGVARLKRFAEQPTQHESYRRLAHSPRGVRPPQSVGGLEVDDWLWGEG